MNLCKRLWQRFTRRLVLCPQCGHWHDGSAYARGRCFDPAHLSPIWGWSGLNELRIAGRDNWCAKCLEPHQDKFDAMDWARIHPDLVLKAYHEWQEGRREIAKLTVADATAAWGPRKKRTKR